MAERRKIRAKYAKKYRKATKAEKTKILNEYLELLGKGNRKYEIYLLNREGKKQLRFLGGKSVNVVITSNLRKKRVYKKYYDEEVQEALIKLWKFFRYICGERLVPLLRKNLNEICRKNNKFGISTEVKEKLSTISRSTVERLLTAERKKHKLKGKGTTKKGELLKNQIPVRVFWKWDDKKPGFCEIDTISHDGGGEINSHYAWSLTVTDVALTWTEVRALKNKAQKWTLEAADSVYNAFPVKIKGVDSDSGAEFINLYFKDWCDKKRINFTRGRARHSNDNCYVEQKNGDVVRKTVGYFRYEGDEALAALEKVYSYLNPLINYFYPTKKCIDKITLPNGKVKRVYEKPLKTPYERVLEHTDISDEDKAKVKRTMARLNIITLQENLEKACEELDYVVTKNYADPSVRKQRHG